MKKGGPPIFEVIGGRGVVTNQHGFYSITYESNSNSLFRVSYVGYNSIEIKASAIKSRHHDFFLTPGVELETFTVKGSRISDLTKTPEISTTRLAIQEIKQMPNLFGEVDIIKAYQLTPGVQPGGEGWRELFVRGGSNDQNFIILDDVPMYYVSHFGGFFTVFNTDAISDSHLIKGGFPARYGGRLSSVLDVRLKDGNLNEFQGQGAIGLLSSKLMLEGPIVKENSSYLVSIRGSLIPTYKLLFQNRINYNFIDLNLKANYRLSPTDRLFFSVYLGDDKVAENRGSTSNIDNTNIRWGSYLASLRYNKVFGQKLFANFLLAGTRYRFRQTHHNEIPRNGSTPDLVTSTIYTGVADYIFKTDFTYSASNNLTVRFGTNATLHSVRPNDETFNRTGSGENVNLEYNSLTSALESSVYLENDFSVGSLDANLGLRGVGFWLKDASYSFMEPRVNLNYRLFKGFSVKGAYSITNQFMHLLSYSGVGFPSDYWMPTTNEVKPGRAEQYTAGFAKSFSKSGLQIGLEGYYKKLENMIAFKPGFSLAGNLSSWENLVERNGQGTNCGVELFLQKTSGRSTGWLGATVSRADRQFENLNSGNAFPFKYDRLLDISLVWNYKISDRLGLSATWTFGSGYPVTLAFERYYLDVSYDSLFGLDYQEVFHYPEINSFRMRDYHRLDVSLSYSRTSSWGTGTWAFSIFNVYNRKNPYYYYYERTRFMPSHQLDSPFTTLKLRQRSLFPFFPSVSYSFKF